MLLTYRNLSPKIAPDVFIAPDADLIGDVTLGEGVSVWFHSVLRGDSGSITVGKNTNIQDLVTVHSGKGYTVRIGERVSIGHNAVVHGCTIGDDTLIGMHATLLNGCVIGKNCLIAAGALVPEGKIIPDGSIVMGVPGKVTGPVTERHLENIRFNAESYLKKAGDYLEDEKYKSK